MALSGVTRLRAIIERVMRPIYREAIRWSYGTVNPKPEAGAASKRLLVVRTDAIGDFVLFTPGLRHLRQIYQGFKISLVINDRCLELACTCPYVDEIIACDVKQYSCNLLYRWRFIRNLRTKRFDVAIYPVYSREPFGEEMIYCSGAPEKIGFDGDLSNITKTLKARNDLHCTRLIQVGPGLALEIERNRAFVEQLAKREISQRDFTPELWVPDADRSYARALLEKAGLHPPHDLVVALFPGSLWDFKRWPATNYVRLGDLLVENYKVKIIVCGSPNEAPTAWEVASRTKQPPVVLAGETTLRQLAALLELCSLYVGNDTGPLHVACAVGIPTLCVMGGGHFGRFYPYANLREHRMVFKKMDCYYCNWQCIYETTRCIQEISVDEVWHETRWLLEEVVLPQRQQRSAVIARGGPMP